MLKLRQWVAVLELLVAAALWGFGFVATTWTLQVLSPLELTFLRFALCVVVGLPILLRSRIRQQWTQLLRLSFGPGLLLIGTVGFLTWGLEYTSPTKSSFITTLYVVFVPLLESAILRKRLPFKIWLCVAGALLGTGMIVDIGFSDINVGDVLTLICALIATVQIYWLGDISPNIKQPFAFNIYQCFWAVVMCAPMVNFSSLWPKITTVGVWNEKALLGLISLAFGSTLIAFYLQVRAQAKLSRTVSSLMFLLESPFALMFSLLLLQEVLSGWEALGALLIFISAFAATWLESKGGQRKIDFTK